jgi:hypothetical protein
LRLCGLRGSKMSSADLAAVIRRRYPGANDALETDLAACEEAAWGETISPREALKLIQTLFVHQEKLSAAARSGTQTPKLENIHSHQQERAS